MPCIIDTLTNHALFVVNHPVCPGDYKVTVPAHIFGRVIHKSDIGPGRRYVLSDQGTAIENTSRESPMSDPAPILPIATSIQIGNTDDRLPQREWCNFINDMVKVMRRYKIWFSGPSEARAPWQCFCWVVEGPLKPGDESTLADLAARYRQHQIAVTTGTTMMVAPTVPSEQWGAQ